MKTNEIIKGNEAFLRHLTQVNGKAEGIDILGVSRSLSRPHEIDWEPSESDHFSELYQGLHNHEGFRVINLGYQRECTSTSDGTYKSIPTIVEPNYIMTHIIFEEKYIDQAAAYLTYHFLYMDCTDCCNAIERCRFWHDHCYIISMITKPRYHS